MTAKNYINKKIPTLQATESVEDALFLFIEQKVSFLPYVNGLNFEGMLSEELLYNLDPNLLLSEIQPIVLAENILDTDPLFETLRKVNQLEIDILPVTNFQNEYLGAIEKLELYQSFVNSLSINEVGGIIEISLLKKDYSLGDLSRIIENENGKILSINMISNDFENITLSIKLDTINISSIISALTRFGYDVSSYYSSEPINNLEKDRYDLLMKYLSI